MGSRGSMDGWTAWVWWQQQHQQQVDVSCHDIISWQRVSSLGKGCGRLRTKMSSKKLKKHVPGGCRCSSSPYVCSHGPCNRAVGAITPWELPLTCSSGAAAPLCLRWGCLCLQTSLLCKWPERPYWYLCILLLNSAQVKQESSSCGDVAVPAEKSPCAGSY